MSNKNLRDVHLMLFTRYANICVHTPDDGTKTGKANLYWMAQKASENINTWPIDKLSRWLGFIQGCLACKGLIDVNGERELTRPYFHEAYAELGLVIPETAEMKNEAE